MKNLNKILAALLLCLTGTLHAEGPTKVLEIGGKQQRGFVKIDMDQVQLVLTKDYVVPRGKTLQIINPRRITFKSTGKRTVTVATVAPHPIYGGGRRGGTRTKEYFASLIVHGKLVLGEKKTEKVEDNHVSKYQSLRSFSFRRVHMSRGSDLEMYNLSIRGMPGHPSVKAYRCHFPYGLGVSSKRQRVFYECLISGMGLKKNLLPRDIHKVVKFKKCVFNNDCRISMSALWVMENCDIYGRPFVIKDYKWGKAPKLRSENFFADDDFPFYLNHAFAEDGLGVKTRTATRPFFPGFFDIK